MLNINNNLPIIPQNQPIQVIDRTVEPNRVPIIGQSERQQQTADYAYNANQNSLNNGTSKNTLKTKTINSSIINQNNNVIEERKNSSYITDINTVNKDNISTNDNALHFQNNNEFEKQMNKVNEQLNGKNLNLSYFQDKETGQLVVQIRDSQTNDVIKQIPPKEVLAVADSISQFLETYDKNGIQNKPVITLPILDESA